jgi:uncharacterized protein YbcI
MSTAVGAEPRPVPPPDGPVTAAISNALVGALKRVCGKGPTRMKAYALEDDIVMVVGSDSLTTAERALVEGGNAHLVQEARRALSDEVADDCRASIEEATGRRVANLVTQVDPVSDSLFAFLRLSD